MTERSLTLFSNGQHFSLPTCRELIWLEAEGIGLVPYVAPDLYDGNYWQHYRELDQTDMGRQLTAARISFVKRIHKSGTLTDVGIGGGRFVLDANAAGFSANGLDINTAAKDWLEMMGFDALTGAGIHKTLTFWDSLEHMPDPSALLSHADLVFISIPIFRDLSHVLDSKHYKPGEHVWYFTHEGLVRYMWRHGFSMIEMNFNEMDIGREGINSYAFRRRS